MKILLMEFASRDKGTSKGWRSAQSLQQLKATTTFQPAGVEGGEDTAAWQEPRPSERNPSADKPQPGGKEWGQKLQDLPFLSLPASIGQTQWGAEGEGTRLS